MADDKKPADEFAAHVLKGAELLGLKEGSDEWQSYLDQHFETAGYKKQTTWVKPEGEGGRGSAGSGGWFKGK